MFVEHVNVLRPECWRHPPMALLPWYPGWCQNILELQNMKKDDIDLVIYKMLKSCIDCWLRSTELLARFGWFSFSVKLQFFLCRGMC